MSFKDLFIVMRFQTLSDAPPRPWPSHVAGLLLRITTKAPNEDEYRPKGEMGRGATIQVNPPIQRWIRPSTESINNLTKHLSTHYGCRVSQLAFYGARLEIWLTGKDLDLTTLPFRAGIIVVWYHLGSTDSQGHEAALRNQIPRNAKPDDAPYGKMLRPGVMLSNGGPQGAELLTTSGAPVRAVSGERFVTVSAHGFPGGAPAIWHPTKQSGQEIGTMVRVLGKTDIGLMRLEPDFRYEADVFDDPEYGGPTLTSFKSISDVKFADPLFLDSPFSGRCDGSAGHFAWRALPEGYENAKEGYWLETLWAYFGDGIPDMLDGTCGSAIFDQNNQVVSFFHLAGENGQAESIAAQHAIDDGLVLEAIAGSNS
ncbi:MAG: hypothetical protein M1832_005381 [Thelocarpon impressellum]|nr:MAG: hypothetical protein M1832_005381 [Thelocarpon impressellum]